MRATRRPLLIVLGCVSLALAGCAAQRAEILGPASLGYPDAAFIHVPEDEYFWIAPPPSGPHGVQPAEIQIPKEGVWVREGWLVVEFQCYSPKDAPQVQTAYPILPETEDEKTLFVPGGHHYLLSCDRRRIGRFELLEDDKAAK